MMETIAGFLLLIGAIGIWLLPTILAVARKHPQTAPIVLIDVLAGWTGIGWIVALAWSVANLDETSLRR
jgi:Superinfection immunity protein